MTGDIVASLSFPDLPGASFALLSNPGGFFALSGTDIVEAINTPSGEYAFSIGATAPGLSVARAFTLQFTAAPSTNELVNANTGNLLINSLTGNFLVH